MSYLDGKSVAEIEDLIENLFAELMLRTELIGFLPPQLTASFVCEKMSSNEIREARAARELAQYLIETGDKAGDLVERCAEEYDRKNTGFSNISATSPAHPNEYGH